MRSAHIREIGGSNPPPANMKIWVWSQKRYEKTGDLTEIEIWVNVHSIPKNIHATEFTLHELIRRIFWAEVFHRSNVKVIMHPRKS